MWTAMCSWKKIARAVGVAIALALMTTAVLSASPSVLLLTSSGFKDGKAIPKRFTCVGANFSPALEWGGAPSGTKSFALLCDDPDAPGGSWVHWLVYAIPAEAHTLAEHAPATETLADGARQGLNSFRKLGYGGPCPPPGERHRYVFTLYALDLVPDLQPGATKAEFLRAVAGHTLGIARLTGTFGQ